MEPSPVQSRIYRFGVFELSRDAAELRKSGIHLKLQDQPFQVLCTLLDHPAELVTREQLRQQLWPDGTFVDFEHGLNTAIKKLRDVLGDDADTPRFIETVPRKGYRFIAPLNETKPVGTTPKPEPKRKVRSPFLALVLASIVLAVASATIYSLTRPRFLRVTATRQLTFDGKVSPFSPIKTDGRRVFYSVSTIVDHRIYSVPTSGGAPSSFDTPIQSPVIADLSPNGADLLAKDVFFPDNPEETRLWWFSSNGGSRRRVGDVLAGSAGWAPGGESIVFSRGRSLFTTNDGGNSRNKLLDTPLPISGFAWSPDTKVLRLSLYDPKSVSGSIWEVKSGSAAKRLLLGQPSDADLCCPLWTRDGKYFLFHRQYDRRSEYLSVDESWFPWRRKVAAPLSAGGLEIASAAASPLDNTIFVVAFQQSGLVYSYDSRSRKLTPLFPELSIIDVHYSRDGQQVQFIERHASTSVLWRARADGTEMVQLTDPKLWVYMAAFSPDGKKVGIMGKYPDQPWKIYWVPSEGGALHQVTGPANSLCDPTWLPDGQSIVFGQAPPYMVEAEASRAIYRTDLTTGAMTKIPGTEGWFSPRVSPDGRFIAALSIDEHRLGILELSKGTWRTVAEDQFNRLGRPVWSSDNGWLYFIVIGREKLMLTRTNVRTSEQQEVVSLSDLAEDRRCPRYDFAPDQKLVISCFRVDANIYALAYE